MEKSNNIFISMIKMINHKINQYKNTKILNDLAQEGNFRELSSLFSKGIVLNEKQREVYYKSNINFFLKIPKYGKGIRYVDFFMNKEEIFYPESLVPAILSLFDSFDFYYYNYYNEKIMKSAYLNHEMYKEIISDYEKHLNYINKGVDNSSVFFNELLIKVNKRLNLKLGFSEAYQTPEGMNAFVDRKESWLFINKFINENKEAFVLSYMDILANHHSLIPEYFMDRIHNLIEIIFPTLDDDLKSIVISTYIYYEEKRCNGKEFKEKKIIDFLNKNYHYKNNSKGIIDNFDKSIFDKKNNTIKKTEGIEKKSQNKLSKEVKEFCFQIPEIKELYDEIQENYKKIVKDEDKVNNELYIVITNFVENKLPIILENFLSYHEFNSILNKDNKNDIKQSEEYSLCLKSLSGINSLMRDELNLMKQKNLTNMKVLNNYINTSR